MALSYSSPRGDRSTDQQSSALDIVRQLEAGLSQLRGRLDRSNLIERPLVTAAFVRTIVQSRRRREAIFGQELFADPCWDMLLSLYSAELSHQRVPTAALCAAAAVPATTALRWIEKLEQSGLISRSPDRFDARRIFINLTGRGSAAMQEYFGGLKSEVLPI